MKSTIYFSFFLFTFCFVNPVFSTIINVPDDHEHIRTALQAADSGDTVLVQPGTYPQFVRFPNKSITLASLFLTTGDPAYIDSTVLSGNDNNPVVQFLSLQAVPTLTGFSITNGRAQSGSGILVNQSSPILTDLKVFGNTASSKGGGLYAYQTDSLFVRNCDFSNNTSSEAGGGIEIFQGNAKLNNVNIFQNESGSGGGIAILQGECHVDFSGGHIYENTASFGGGLYMTCGSTTVFNDVEISDNEARSGGAVHISGNSELEMNYCLVVNNTASERGSALFLIGAREKHFTNVTITQNISNNIMGIYIGGSDNFFTNCIIYENGELNIYGYENSTTTFSYTDLEGGEDGIDLNNNATINWLEGNIDADPEFVGIECRDYALTMDSPCLDAGDPNSPNDADFTVADIGGLPCLRFSRLCGLVRDAGNRECLENVNIIVSNGFHTVTDENGQYNLMAISGIFDVRFSSAGYNDSVFSNVEFNLNDTLELNVSLLHPEFEVSHGEVTASVEQGFSATEQISIVNDANGPLEWAVEFTVDTEEGMKPYEIRREFPVGEILEDNFLYGAVYDGENYRVSGRGGIVPMIYVINPEGDLIKQYPQPGNSDRGMRDLAWDGELFWGSENREVYGFNSRGEVLAQWTGPFNPSSNITWDNERELLWISATTSDIVAYNRDGEPQITINRNGLRIYGLAYWQDDPDGFPLYVLHKKQDMDCSSMSKVNPETGEFIFVRDFTELGGLNLNGAFITRDYDPYGGWVLMTISNIGEADGGDRLKIFQLESNLFFVDMNPARGVINPGETGLIDIVFETTTENGINLDFGSYTGNLRFTHNAMGGQSLIPIELNVLDPASVATGGEILPDVYEISNIYPNPFNSYTNIDFNLPEASIVKMSLYDLSGRLIRNLAKGQYTAGSHNVTLEGSTLVSGLYLIKLDAGKQSLSRKVMLLK